MDTKKEIGGYFELELTPNKKEYHSDAVKLNSGRYCLQYIFKTKKYKKIYLPAYICDSVLQPIKNEDLSYEFYSINKCFEPIFEKQIKDDECFMYVDYFGINDKNVKNLVSEYENIIIDNTQAFFTLPYKNIDTFYSARKFFGVADGAYLYTNINSPIEIERGITFDRSEYLLKRIDISANEGYTLFRKNEEHLKICGLKKMSKLTETILRSIDYEKCRDIRNKNFLFLHKKLSKYNELDLDIDNLNGPMVYPFMKEEENIKGNLIANKIYVATYWNEARKRVYSGSFEDKLIDYLIPLPIDQRYKLEDMEYIVDFIESRGILK